MENKQLTNTLWTAILNTLPISICLYDKVGTLLRINDATCQLFGVDASQIATSPLNITQSPAIPDEVKNALLQGQPIHTQFPYNFKQIAKKNYYSTTNKKTILIECQGYPVHNAAGEIEIYVITMNDITEKKKKEETLRQNQHRIELAMDVADIMFWEFDVLTKQLFGENEPLNDYQPMALQPNLYIDNTHPDDREKIIAIFDRMSAGEDFSFTINYFTRLIKNKEWQYCAVTGSPYKRDQNGRVLKYVGIRKNNTELYKTKQLQDKILNDIPLSIHIKDIENGSAYLFCNEESKRMFGTSEEKTIFDVMDKEGVERIWKTDIEVFNTGVPYTGLEKITLKDGRIHNTIVRKSIIENNGKRLLLNIRWEQGLQNELKRQAKLLSVTLEAMNAFTWFYEPDKTRVSFGEGFDKIGRNASEISSLDAFLDCLHPDDRTQYVESLQEVAKQDSGFWQTSVRIDFNKTGTYSWWEARGVLETTIINDIPYKYMFGMSICIESHKQIEETLLKNKEDLNNLILQNEQILNNTNSGLAFITTDYVVQWENISKCSASLSYEAYKQGEICYKSAHNRSTPCKNCVLQRTMQSHQMEQIKFKLDDNHTVEIFATPVFHNDGSLNGIVIRVDDITERERMIEELKLAKQLAEQSDKLKSAFLANMSHEIRTPLNAIVGFSELLLNAEIEEEEKSEYASIIKNNNELLLRLISDILDLSKIESGIVELKYEPFDLAELFNEMAISMQQRITNPNLRLIAINPYTSCIVNMDKNRFAQIFTNFITNAIKYTPKGFIEMGYESVSDGIRIYVRDTGIGISDEKKNKVFHRFAKLDEFAQGTGLGLSICKAIVESMGGSIDFESIYGQGSMFWAILPCKTEIRDTAKIHENTPINKTRNTFVEPCKNTSTKQKVILIAEDIQSNYLLLSALLRKEYRLLHAQNGVQAVEMVQNNQVDMIFMDMKMPEMNGLDATIKIRTFNTQLPIIALTAHAFESDRQAALEAGCNDYLVKPIDKTKLIETLQKHLSTTDNN